MPRAHSSSPNNAYASSRMNASRDALKKQSALEKQGAQSRTAEKPHCPAALGRSLSAQKRKALLASGAAATLMVAVVLPDQVSSEAIAQSNCLEVIQSGAEMSRGEISTLITLPVGSPKQSVRQAISEPYCTLPIETTEATEKQDAKSSSEQGVSASTEREAYPLAFDPEVWVVLNYESGKYTSYDFVFRP
ncbi:MAG: hypothetical protein AAF716_15370 [Cyanobacteria bacterium P01_D01_bin.1]